MNWLFSFFLRLFVCFLAAKFLVQAVDLNSRTYLLSLTALLIINVYLFEILVYRDRRAPQESPPEAAPKQSLEEQP
ncbi:MAG: hypothetical protein ACLQED_12485 [Desulfobaccales bacterium]|jgi:hypothetical protein